MSYQSDADGQYYDTPADEEAARNGQAIDHSSDPAPYVPPSSSSSSSSSAFDANGFFQDLAKQTGATYEQGDADKLLANAQNKGMSLDQAKQQFTDQYTRRGSSGQQGSGQDSTTLSGGNGQVQTRAPQFAANTSPMFTDPSQRLVEDTALGRLQQLQNPAADSGQGMYEAYAKQLADILQQAPYTQQDDAALKAQAFNALEQDRTSTHQRYLEELSKRGISPSSGVALDGFKQIDSHYDQLRATVTNQMAVNGINLAQNNRLQSLDVLGGLAGTQNTRLNQALDVSRIPYNLGTDAFNMNLQTVNAGGNPSANVSTAIQLANAIQNNQNLDASQRAAYLEAIFNFIGRSGT